MIASRSSAKSSCRVASDFFAFVGSAFFSRGDAKLSVDAVAYCGCNTIPVPAVAVAEAKVTDADIMLLVVRSFGCSWGYPNLRRR